MTPPRRDTAASGDAGLLDPEFLRQLEALSLVTRRRVASLWQGERRSIVRGRGIEFDDYRAYQPGDDYRYIDWNVVSRMDRLFVKLFSEDEDLDVHVLVDTSASMAAGQPSKLSLAKRLAAAIGYIGLTNLDRVAVTAVTSSVGSGLRRLRGRGRAFDLLRFLDGLHPSGRTHLEVAVRQYIAGARGRALLVVISDLLDPHGYEAGLLLAVHHHFQIFLIHILASEELEPALAGDLRLIDVETQDAVEITADADGLRAYADARDAYFGEIERFCLRHGIDYLRTASTVPVDALVLRYLRQGGLVR